MDLSQDHIKEVDRRLVETIITALREDFLTADEYDEVADFVVKGMDNVETVKTQDELLRFLRELSSKWKIFTHVLVVESAATRDTAEDKVYENAVALAESGNIEEAVAVAKSATEAPAEASTEPAATTSVAQEVQQVPAEGGQTV